MGQSVSGSDTRDAARDTYVGDVDEDEDDRASAAELEQERDLFTGLETTVQILVLGRSRQTTNVAINYGDELTKAAGTMSEMTETVIKDEFSWATIGWNSWDLKRKPPTVEERVSHQTRGTATTDVRTDESHSEYKQHVTEQTAKKRALYKV